MSSFEFYLRTQCDDSVVMYERDFKFLFYMLKNDQQLLDNLILCHTGGNSVFVGGGWGVRDNRYDSPLS